MTLSVQPTLPELLRIVMDKSNEVLFSALPSKVEKYDENLQIADIKPLLKMRETAADGSNIVDTLGVIPDVPVIHPRGGGFFSHLPLKKGNNVLLLFIDRSIDEFVESDGITDIEPQELRINDISDAVAIPGFYTNRRPIKGITSNDFIMGTEDGNGIIKIEKSGIVDINGGNLRVLV